MKGANPTSLQFVSMALGNLSNPLPGTFFCTMADLSISILIPKRQLLLMTFALRLCFYPFIQAKVCGGRYNTILGEGMTYHFTPGNFRCLFFLILFIVFPDQLYCQNSTVNYFDLAAEVAFDMQHMQAIELVIHRSCYSFRQLYPFRV